MPRTFSETVRAVLDAQHAEVHDAIVLTLPQMVGDSEPIRLFLATANVAMNFAEFGQQTCIPHLRKVGAITFTLGSSPDQASAEIQNVDNSYSDILNETERTLDGAECIIYRGFLTGATSSGYETEELFRGYVRSVNSDEEKINFQVLGELSRKGAAVGGEPITQHCRFVFNEQGSGIGPECGWQPGQGGNPDFCEHTPEDCLAHGNRWRFGGVRPPADETTRVNTGIILNDDGFGGYGPDGYPHIGRWLDPDYLTR